MHIEADNFRFFPLPKQNAFSNNALNALNPYIRMAYYGTIEAHTSIPERVIYDYELLYVKSGHATITIEDQVYQASMGDMFFFKPDQRHSIVAYDEPLVQPHIHFDLMYQDNSTQVPISFVNREQMTEEQIAWIRPDITNSLFDPFPSYIRLPNPLYVEQLLFEVISAYNSPNLYTELQLKWRFLRLLEQLLYELNWEKTQHRNFPLERALHIKLYLEHTTDHAVTLDELAGVYHVDKSYISRTFKEAYGISPIRFHLLHRIKKAKEMIYYTNISITNISEQLGFSTLQDFSRAFQRIEGMPPSYLRHMSGNQEKRHAETTMSGMK